MQKSDMVFLGLAAAGLAAIVIWRNSLPSLLNGIPVSSQDDASPSGPTWLVYNDPWGYNAALGGANYSVMPSRTVGQVGQVGDMGATQNFSSDCGCE